MGDKNPKKQKKKKRVVEKPSLAPISTDQKVEEVQNTKPKKPSRGR